MLKEEKTRECNGFRATWIGTEQVKVEGHKVHQTISFGKGSLSS